MKSSAILYSVLMSAAVAPVAASDWQYVGGEAGWRYVGGSAERPQRFAQRAPTPGAWERVGGVGGEAVWRHVGQEIDRTRSELDRERERFESRPFAAGGWRWVGGEAGWSFRGA
jgi:hypothetical protein